LDLDKLKRAIETVESQSGRNNCPRFERSYMPKGDAFTIQGRLVIGTGGNFNAVVRPRWDKYGLATAASYGPAQILYHTAADLGFQYHPAMLWANQALHDYYVLKRLERIQAQGATMVEQFADGWNSGNCNDTNVPQLYIDAVKKAWLAL
jgi:hypothetical protein